MQPNDQGIIAAFKAQYRKQMLRQVLGVLQARIDDAPEAPIPRTLAAEVIITLINCFSYNFQVAAEFSMHHMMVCINEARNYFIQHPEIVINCWKHSKLDSLSTEAFIPSLPNVMAQLDDEFYFLMSQIAQYTGDCIAPDTYLMIDNNEEAVNSTLDVQDIINEVRFESAPPEEEEDDIKPPEISRSEWNQCRQTPEA